MLHLSGPNCVSPARATSVSTGQQPEYLNVQFGCCFKPQGIAALHAHRKLAGCPRKEDVRSVSHLWKDTVRFRHTGSFGIHTAAQCLAYTPKSGRARHVFEPLVYICQGSLSFWHIRSDQSGSLVAEGKVQQPFHSVWIHLLSFWVCSDQKL